MTRRGTFRRPHAIGDRSPMSSAYARAVKLAGAKDETVRWPASGSQGLLPGAAGTPEIWSYELATSWCAR
jgi:hypothetical protein